MNLAGLGYSISTGTMSWTPGLPDQRAHLPSLPQGNPSVMVTKGVGAKKRVLATYIHPKSITYRKEGTDVRGGRYRQRALSLSLILSLHPRGSWMSGGMVLSSPGCCAGLQAWEERQMRGQITSGQLQVCGNADHGVPGPAHQGGRGIWGWLAHENGPLTYGINTLILEAPESSLAPSAVCRHGEKIAVYEPGSGSSSDAKSTSDLILDFIL